MDPAARLRERELASIRVQLANSQSGDLLQNVLKSFDERGGAQELVRQRTLLRLQLMSNGRSAA
jgi:hypothetical protein